MRKQSFPQRKLLKNAIKNVYINQNFKLGLVLNYYLGKKLYIEIGVQIGLKDSCHIQLLLC